MTVIFGPIPKLSRADADGLAILEQCGKVLSEPVRLGIIQMLMNSPAGCTPTSMQKRYPLGLPGISYHLKMMLDIGLVEHERRGGSHIYTLNHQRRDEILAAFQN